MGLFDNIIGNGAVEEVDPLGMEHITDESNGGTSDAGNGGTTTGTGNGGSTGNSGGGMFSGFGGKKDDSKGQDGSVLIIKNEVPDVVNLNIPQEVTPVIDVGGIDTNSEIPDIDIGGDMNFGAITDESNTPSEVISNMENTVPNGGIVINQTTQGVESNTTQGLVTPMSNPVINLDPAPIQNTNTIQVQEVTTNTIQVQSAPVGGINSLFGNITDTTPATPEATITNTGLTENNTPINIGLISLTEEAPVGVAQPSVPHDNSSETSINILSGLSSSSDTPAINSDSTTGAQESPIKTIPTESINLIDNTSSPEAISPALVTLDTPPEQISPKAVNIATDIQKTKESLAERISEFLKELEALKANDEALLKEKQAAIAKLEEAKKPIEEELQKIKADEQRINETIDLLSNIKNI